MRSPLDLSSSCGATHIHKNCGRMLLRKSLQAALLKEIVVWHLSGNACFSASGSSILRSLTELLSRTVIKVRFRVCRI